MKGWILYKRNKQELLPVDHGVNRLLAVASRMRLDLDVFRPDQFDILTRQNRVYLDGRLTDMPDFLIPRIGADTNYHALALIRQLEWNGVFCANGAAAVELAKDKMRVSQLLTAHQLPTPESMLVNFPPPVNLIEQEIGFPLVVKSLSGARGIGVHLCQTALDLRDLLGLFSPQYDNRLLVQRYISSSYGRDLRVFVLNQRVVGCMQRTAKDSFKANYSLGGDVSPFPVTDEIEHLSLSCARLVGLDIAGIDLLFGESGFLICEANSSPGFKGMELATEEDIAGKILHYCQQAVEHGHPERGPL